MKKWCMTCGGENDYKNQSCGSCNESFDIKIEPIKQSSAGITKKVGRTNFTGDLEDLDLDGQDQFLKEFDFASLVKELEQQVKQNSADSLNKSISGRDLFKP